MKQFIIIFLLGVFSASSFASANKTETIVIKTKIHCDHCLQCESCGLNINRGTRKAKGIKKIKIDPEANTITVTYRSDKTNPDEIRKAIAASGFDADGVKAVPAAYEKLDGCCKA